MVNEALKMPNKTHPDVPIGAEDKNKILREVDGKTSSLPEGVSHTDIAEQFDLIDFASASKLTGNKFVFLKNEAALLEMALTTWALNFVAKRGYTPVTTPDLARQQVVEACGFQPRDDSSQVYHLEGSNECLIGTAEIPLAGMYANEIVDKTLLPHKMVAYSHCFRAEAGKG